MSDIIELVSKFSEIKQNLERKWESGTQRSAVSVALTADALIDTIDIVEELSKSINSRLKALEDRCALLEKA